MGLWIKDGVLVKYMPENDAGGEMEVVVPDGVTEIGRYAFGRGVFEVDCSLKKAVLPEGVTVLQEGAFKDCLELEEVVLPGTLTCIRKEAFSRCKKLREIRLPGTLSVIESFAFSSSGIERIVIPDAVEKIGHAAFFLCDKLTEVTLSPGLQIIEGSAFYGCRGLKRVVLPDSVKEIGRNAFEHCDSLEEVVLPAKAEVMEGAFHNCKSLKKMIIPGGMSKETPIRLGDLPAFTQIELNGESPWFSLRDGVLYSKDGKTLILFPSGRTDSEFIIPPGVTTIAAGAFGYSHVGRVVFSNDVQLIESGAFLNSAIREAVIPEEVQQESGAFLGCRQLEKMGTSFRIQVLGDGETVEREYIPETSSSFVGYVRDENGAPKGVIIRYNEGHGYGFNYPDKEAVLYPGEIFSYIHSYTDTSDGTWNDGCTVHRLRLVVRE